MKRILTGIFACLLVLVARSQEGAEVLKQVTSWQAVVAEAQKENKLIFVDTYFTGCHPCAQMDKEVFPNRQVRKAFDDNFVAVKVDVFKEKLGDTLVKKFALSGFPTFLIFHSSGKLLSRFSGFKDAGLLLTELKTARQRVNEGKFYSGFGAAYADSYPDFYKAYYNREDKKPEPSVANAWIKAQTDWTAEPVAVSIFRTGRLDSEIEQYFVKSYAQYKSLYGTDLARDKVTNILTSRLGQAVKAQKDETAFRKFLSDHANRFPAEDWPVIQHQLAYHYYGSVAKDTTALLQFMSAHPVIHQNYFGALYNMMLVKKQLNESTLPYLQTWADGAVNEESAFDIIRTAASINQRAKNDAGYKKYVAMLLAKAAKYDVPDEAYRKMLAAATAP